MNASVRTVAVPPKSLRVSGAVSVGSALLNFLCCQRCHRVPHVVRKPSRSWGIAITATLAGKLFNPGQNRRKENNDVQQ